METLNWLITAIKNEVLHAAWAVISNCFFYALIGLIAGGISVWIAGQLGAFRRSSGFWSVIAGLNYLFIPLLFTVFGGAMGFVQGAYSTAERFIDKTTKPLVNYGERYMARLQQSLAQIPAAQSKNMSVEQAMDFLLVQESKLTPGSYSYMAASKINKTVLNYALDGLKIPKVMCNNPLILNRQLKTKTMKISLFTALPMALHEACDAFFWYQFRIVWLFFQPFFLIPIAEFLLYRLYRLIAGPSRYYGNSAWG